MVITVMPTATTTPANQPSMLAPGLIAAASATSPPLSTSAAPPRVRTLSGRASRLSVRPHERVECGSDDRGHERPGGAVDVEVRKHRAEQEQRAPVQKQHDQAADGESPEPGHAASVTRVRVIQPHPLRVTTPHPSGA